MKKRIFKKRELEELIDKDGAIIDGDDKPNQFQNQTGSQSTTDDFVKTSRQDPSLQGGYAWGGLFGISAMGISESLNKSEETDLKIYKSELNFLNKIKSTSEKSLNRKKELEKLIQNLEKKQLDEIKKQKFIEILKEQEENTIGLEPKLNDIIYQSPIFHRTLKYMIDMGNMDVVSGDVLYAGFYNLLKTFDFSTINPEQKQILTNLING